MLVCRVKPQVTRARASILAPLTLGLLMVASVATGQTGLQDSKARAKDGDFDARGTVPCAQIRGQELGECSAGVARGPDGEATVVVTFSNGFSRQLYFAGDAFVRANATMSGVGTDISERREAGVRYLRVDDQRFELPDGLIFGE